MPVLLSTQKLKRRPIAAAEVRVRAERMLRALDLEDAELSLLLCDDTTIRELNRDYRGIDRATDVLAFPQEEGLDDRVLATQPRVLGDVAISLDTARKQARAAGKTIVSEVTMLLAHGLLHLLGYDHRTPVEERGMKARTDALCAAARPPGPAA